jgi:hypothetical protein
MSSKYTVTLDEYTERHFIKNFKKKYSDRAWQFTETALKAVCVNFEETVQLDLCDTISHLENLRLCKLDFAVAGTGKSPKSSANRCILVANVEKHTVHIVLIYHKSDIVKSGNETVAWKQIVKENFPEYRDLFS